MRSFWEFFRISIAAIFFCLTAQVSFSQGHNGWGDINSKSQSGSQAAFFENYIHEMYAAFDKGDNDKLFSYYAANAAEISPDGRFTAGLVNLRASFEEGMKMLDAKPRFTNKFLSYRLIDSDIAIVVWESDADIKIGGQQIGGKTLCSAVLRKIKNQWLIEFDSLTPIMPAPEVPTDK